MLIPIDKIKDAKHVLILTNTASFSNASVIYSYILTHHKKVSISYEESIDKNLSFLPWFDKLRAVSPSSADLTVEVDGDSKALFEFLKNNKIKINQKMATALYSGLLKQYDFFNSAESDGTTFAAASELISLKAEYKLCSEYLQRRVSISALRLKAILLKSLLLKDNATKALLFVSDMDFKATGATVEEAYVVMKEVLNLVNVKEVELLKTDENSKIIKHLKEI